jgi:hypothetical protein
VSDEVVLTFYRLADLLAWRVGDRVEFRPRATWRTRVWRWLTKQNYRVVSIDFDIGTLTVGRCR